MKGWTQPDELLEEVQASLRAARFTPELTKEERIILMQEAKSRLPDGAELQDVVHILYATER